MNNGEVLSILVAVVSTAALVFMMAWSRRRQQRWVEYFQGREGFQPADASFLGAGPGVSLRRDGLQVTVRPWANKQYRWFDVTVTPSPLGSRTTLRVSPEHLGTRLLASLGFRDIQVGIPLMDDTYRIAGSRPDAVRAILQDAAVEDALRAVFGPGEGRTRVHCKPQRMDVRVDNTGLTPEEAEAAAHRVFTLAVALRGARARPAVAPKATDTMRTEGNGAVAAVRVQAGRKAGPGILSWHYTWVFLPLLVVTMGYASLTNTLSILTCQRDVKPTRAQGWCDLKRGSWAFAYNEVISIGALKGASVESGMSDVGSHGKEGAGRRIYIHAGSEHHRFLDNDAWSEERRGQEVARINAFVQDPSQMTLDVRFDRRPLLFAQMFALTLLVGACLTWRAWRDENG